MTFDEAIKEINEAYDLIDYADMANTIDDIVVKLKEEYAPTIEMTKKERINFLNAKNSGKSFYDLWGHYKLNSNNSLGRNYNEEQLVQAWLHPETIKVIEEEA